MRVTHVITRLIVGGAQENTVATVLGLVASGVPPDVEPWRPARRREHTHWNPFKNFKPAGTFGWVFSGRRDAKPFTSGETPDATSEFGLKVDLISGPTLGPEGSLESAFASHPGLLTIIPSLVRPVHPWNDWMALRHLTKIFRETKPDIVHTHSGKAGILGRLAAKRAGVPIILHTIHGPSFGDFQNGFANLVFRSAEKYAARFTTQFVSVANAMTEQYLAAGIGTREKFTRIFSGFPLEPFLNSTNDPALRQKLGIAPNDFVVGKIARLFELKGHEDLFAIAPNLIARCPRIKFLLVGDGKWRQRFEFRARSLGLEKHFVFTGLIPPNEVPRHVGIMDALVHLSRREGLPRALPQALAAGKPVVAYDCDGANEICLPNETGYLIRPGDTAELAEKILELESNPELRRRFGNRGQGLVKECFSVEGMVENIYALYVKLARNSVNH